MGTNIIKGVSIRFFFPFISFFLSVSFSSFAVFIIRGGGDARGAVVE